MLQCVAGCCSVLQFVAVCCSVEWIRDNSHEWIHGHVGWIHGYVKWIIAECCSVLQCVAVLRACMTPLMSRYMDMLGGVLQCVAVCCSVLQYVAVCCSVLQC